VAPVRPLKLRFAERARIHLRSIQEYIGERNPRAAARVGAEIRDAAEMLRHFPLAGRFGRSPDTHEWVVRSTPYIIVYEVNPTDQEIVVLGVFHGAQEHRDVGR
jgi:plasmid stabilization system protein ParE